MPQKSKTLTETTWSAQVIGLIGLVLIGSIIAYYVSKIPNSFNNIFTKTSNVGFHQVAALVLLSVLTIIYLAYFRAKLFFSTEWFVAAIVYNFLILFIKFTLSTNEFPSNTAKTFNTVFVTALLVGLLYALGLLVVYLFFDGRILSKKLHKSLITSIEGKVLLAMGVFIFATVARIILFRLPILSGTVASSYLNEVFKTNSILLSLLIFIICLAAVEAYAQVRRRADLKYFFVTGLTLILSFHLWWAIFVYRGY